MTNLRTIREKSNITPEKLAEESGFRSATKIKNFEEGKSSLRVSDAMAIVRALHRLGANCTLDDVFPTPHKVA